MSEQRPEPENPEVKEGDVADDPATPIEDEVPQHVDETAPEDGDIEHRDEGHMPDHDTEVGA